MLSMYFYPPPHLKNRRVVLKRGSSAVSVAATEKRLISQKVLDFESKTVVIMQKQYFKCVVRFWFG